LLLASCSESGTVDRPDEMLNQTCAREVEGLYKARSHPLPRPEDYVTFCGNYMFEHDITTGAELTRALQEIEHDMATLPPLDLK
jgi:hypothetical protein